MKKCRYCRGMTFDLIGGFIKVCLTCFSFSKINKELGWKPSVTFEEGLGKTIDWFLENKEWLEHVTSGDYQKYYSAQYLND